LIYEKKTRGQKSRVRVTLTIAKKGMINKQTFENLQSLPYIEKTLVVKTFYAIHRHVMFDILILHKGQNLDKTSRRQKKAPCLRNDSGHLKKVLRPYSGSGEPVFTSMITLLYGPLALKRPIFKQKKGFATISLDIIYQSMSQWSHLDHHLVTLFLF
jgi:hypothetical protein